MCAEILALRSRAAEQCYEVDAVSKSEALDEMESHEDKALKLVSEKSYHCLVEGVKVLLFLYLLHGYQPSPVPSRFSSPKQRG